VVRLGVRLDAPRPTLPNVHMTPNPRAVRWTGRRARRGRVARLAAAALVAAAAFEAYLLLGGRRVLVAETKVEPGQSYVVEGWGDLGKAPQPSLACRYFTGRSITTAVWWYSAGNFRGRDSCPFVYKPA